MRKKILLILFSILIIFGTFGLISCSGTTTSSSSKSSSKPSGSSSSDKTETDGTLIYKLISAETHYMVESSYYEVVGVKNLEMTHCEIPETFKSLPVKLGISAFQDCAKLKTVSFPNSVTYISYMAFYNCTSLESMVLPERITFIEMNAFYNCTSLKSITIPKTMERMAGGAFSSCTSLERVDYTGTIDEWATISFESVGANPLERGAQFYVSGQKVTDIVLNSVTKIGSNAFSGFDAVTSIEIGSQVTIIGDGAFKNCENVESITFKDNSQLKETGEGAFKGLINLRNVIIPDGVTEISVDSFKDCTSLVQVSIPSTVTIIDSNAFYNCGLLGKITYRGNSQLSEIGWYAFGKCHSLISIVIPSKLSKIEYGFGDCERLIEVIDLSSFGVEENKNQVFGGIYHQPNYFFTSLSQSKIVYKDDFVFLNDNGTYSLVGYCGINDTLTLPSQINGKDYIIAEKAFQGHEFIKKVTLNGGVTKIGRECFSYCPKLQEVKISSSVVEIEVKAFCPCSSLTKVVFDVTSGWRAVSATNNVSLTLDDSAKNAEYLKDTYVYYEFLR